MTRTTDSIRFAIDQLEAITNTVTLHRLAQIFEYEKSEGWREDGASSMEHWVSYRFGKTLGWASEEVRVARALTALPHIAEAFGEGLLSWQKVVDLCTFVSPEEDERWSKTAQRYPASRIKQWAQMKRRVTRAEAAKTDRKRTLRMWWDDDVLRFEGALPSADGALFKRAIERHVEQQPKPPDGQWPPLMEQQADALVDLAATRLESDPDKARATVVVHVDAAELARPDGVASLESAPVVSAVVAERLACDGYVQVVTHGEDGSVIGVGRRSRVVPKWLERLVRERDGSCVCCGSDQVVGSEIHHVVPWALGGRTDLDNLVLVCRRCHRMLHDRGASLDFGSRDVVRDGRVINRPAKLRPEVRDRMVGPPPKIYSRPEVLKC